MRDPAIDETERRREIEVERIEWGEFMYGWVEGVRLNYAGKSIIGRGKGIVLLDLC
jgi:hypothetical protein